MNANERQYTSIFSGFLPELSIDARWPCTSLQAEGTRWWYGDASHVGQAQVGEETRFDHKSETDIVFA